MRRVPIDSVKENDVLDENIYRISGSLLLGSGVKLTSKLIARLKEMGFQSVSIKDERFEGLDIKRQDALRDDTRAKTLTTTKKIMDHFQKTGEIIGIKEVEKVVDSLLNDILGNKDIGLDLTGIQSFDTGLYTHSVSVTVLSLYVAKQLNCNLADLKNIGIGCLLHDIGKLYIPKEILNKPGSLTDEEFDIVKKHPMDGFKQLKDKIPLRAAHIALQHHEKYDGSGYPRGIQKEDIHFYARITAVADVYDAMTMDRPYRKGMPSHQAIKIMLQSSENHFDRDILKKFLGIISSFPNGCIVKLNSGDKAIVRKQNKGFPLSPHIIIFERDGNRLNKYIKMNLMNEFHIKIAEICAE